MYRHHPPSSAMAAPPPAHLELVLRPRAPLAGALPWPRTGEQPLRDAPARCATKAEGTGAVAGVLPVQGREEEEGRGKNDISLLFSHLQSQK